MFERISWTFLALLCLLAIIQVLLLLSLAPTKSFYSSGCTSQAQKFQNKSRGTPTCGYNGCPKLNPEKLNVHLVPHSHDDVGWLKTVEEYFYGLRQNIQEADVQSIINSVIQELRNDPDRRFIYVETAYLWKWWELQNEQLRDEVRRFVNEGRLEIVGGAWSMNDEATTYYQSIIDQFTWGFRRLNDAFGACARPKIGWQIDPFGHSREQASIFAQLGFDGMFIGRLDYQDKKKRLAEKTAEFLWQASPNLGERADLFSSILFNNYGPPPGFCFDTLCSATDIIDDPNTPYNNVKEKMKAFYDYVKEQVNHYQTNNIILTMGGDFNYQHAEKYFRNLDKLIRYMNELYGEEVNVFYSTPSCYLKSVHQAKKIWTTKTDDFFSYASGSHSYWTGYFTSRPTLKYFERLGNSFLQVSKQLSVLSGTMESKHLEYFREVMGVMQHHDAVTGTERQHVAADYARLLADAMVRSETLVSKAIAKLSQKEKSSLPQQQFKICLLLNISSCELTENAEVFVVTLYNPRSHAVSHYVRIPVHGKKYVIKDHCGKEHVTQLVPIPVPVTQIPGRTSKATRELIFHASEIPPLGYKSFYVTEIDTEDTVDEICTPEDVLSFGGDLYDISVNDTGRVIIAWKKKELKVFQAYYYYEGETKSRPSGAYTFRPKESLLHDFEFIGSYKIYRGPLAEELHLTLHENLSQVVRVYNGEDRIEFDWLVGPIPVNDRIGKEVVTIYASTLASNGVFYTDSNGREVMKRIRNYRETWDVELDEPIAGNYYPITTKISLQDEERKLRMSVLTDRAEGGTSMKDGELEVMLHRRLRADDGLGVSEPLNEKAFGSGLVARGTHFLVESDLKNLAAAAMKEKSLTLSLTLKPWILITPVENLTFNQWQTNYSMQKRGLRNKLPPNVNILTLEPWANGEILLRLEHLFEIGEAGRLSDSVEINLTDLFADFDIIGIRETTLGGNQWIDDMRRLKWTTQSRRIQPSRPNVTTNFDFRKRIFKITLTAMEIRTFIIAVKSVSKFKEMNG